MSWGRASSNLRDHCSKRRRHCVMIVLVIVSLQTKNCFLARESCVRCEIYERRQKSKDQDCSTCSQVDTSCRHADGGFVG